MLMADLSIKHVDDRSIVTMVKQIGDWSTIMYDLQSTTTVTVFYSQWRTHTRRVLSWAKCNPVLNIMIQIKDVSRLQIIRELIK